MMQRNCAYNLIECLLVVTLIGIIATSTFPSFDHLWQTLQAHLTLGQLRQILQLSRSQAIANNGSVTLCGSSNGYSCNQSWRGVLLESSPGVLHYFDLRLSPQVILLLTQSGKTANKVVIQANGMAQTNGHFSYKSLKGSNATQFNLYFNKALKMYEHVGG